MSFRQVIRYVPTLCLTGILTGATTAPPAVRIDSIADKYALQTFSFEVSPDTRNAGILLEYIYPPARLGGDDSDRGPDPRAIILPGLTYDETTRAIIYDDGTTRTTCATETDRRILFWKSAHMKPTGACIVTTRLTHHANNDGWRINRFNTLDAWFEVRPK
jgi:hypothetical protein